VQHNASNTTRDETEDLKWRMLVLQFCLLNPMKNRHLNIKHKPFKWGLKRIQLSKCCVIQSSWQELEMIQEVQRFISAGIYSIHF